MRRPTSSWRSRARSSSSATWRKRARPIRRSSAPGPGRFLLPGDLAGSPLLTFFPLPPTGEAGYARGSLGAMLARRFESYKSHVVKPFFRDHFARLDRQIVLVDALSAINGGPEALADLERNMEAILACFRPGANTWLSTILARRIDRLLFAATKADHLHHTSHDRLEAILRQLTDRAIARASFAGAEVKAMALAALRATHEAEARQGRQRLPCIVGVPLPGEQLGRKVFDGKTEAAVFPGDLPEDPSLLKIERPARRRAFPPLPSAAREPRQPLRRGAAAASYPPRPRHRLPARRPPGMSGASDARKPQAFAPDDPALVTEPAPEEARAAGDIGAPPAPDAPLARPTLSDLGARGLRWGLLLVSALAGAAFLGAAAWFGRLVSAALVRDDWLGWTTLALMLIAALAAFMLLLREVAGFFRLARLGRLRADVAAAIRERDQRRERKAALRLAALYAGRPDAAWSVRRFREHARDVHDPGRAAGAGRPRSRRPARCAGASA